jgi:Subtilase family
VRNVRRFWSILLAIALLALSTAAGAVGDPSNPNDPFWPYEWGPRLTRASDLWQETTGDPKIVIAVVDTGLAQVPVPDMTQVVPGWDVVGNDANTNDTFGHGTWVTSIIGALGDNNAGIAGYCWHCSIMPIRVAAGHEGGVASNIATGIRWAVDHGARIINVSLVGNQFDEDELGAVEYAQQSGVIVVTSAGNTGDTTPMYPAFYGTQWKGVLSVAGTDQNDQLEDWATHGSWVDLTAPGCAELLDPTVGPASGCGSSYAPAAVSGIIGLLLSLNPSLTLNQITDALKATAHHVDGVAYGRVDAWAAAHALGLVPESPPPPPAPAPAQPTGTGSPPPAPSSNASPEVLVSTGYVRRSESFPLELKPGRLQLQLFGPAARDCSMRIRVGGSFYFDLPGERNVRTLAATIRKRGTYTVGLSCESVNRKSYEFTATGMFVG